MATLAEIRAALADQIAAGVPGLRAHAGWPGGIVPPCAVVARRETQFDVDFDGDDDHTLTVRVLVSLGDDRSAQDALDQYLSPDGERSLAAAVHADPTLGGLVAWCRVVSAERDQIATHGAVEYLTGDLVLEVGA